MHCVDFVRFGAMAAGQPLAGTLYAQAVWEHTQGLGPRTTDEYAFLLGIGPRQVFRVWERLEAWGLVRRVGSTNKRRVELLGWPNERFCEDVIDGVFGSDFRSRESKQAEGMCLNYRPCVGSFQPMSALAVAVVLKRYGNSDFFPYFAQLVTSELMTSAHSYLNMYTYTRTTDHEVSKEQMSQVDMSQAGAAHGPELVPGTYVVIVGDTPDDMTVYPTTLPAGFTLPSVRPVSAMKSRAGKQRRYETLPEHSNGFVYWPNDRLPLDEQYYPTIMQLLADWQALFGTTEYLNWKLYIPLRECLAERGLSREQLQRAFQVASTDRYWKDRLTLYRLASNPHIVQELLQKAARPDPYLRHAAVGAAAGAPTGGAPEVVDLPAAVPSREPEFFTF